MAGYKARQMSLFSQEGSVGENNCGTEVQREQTKVVEVGAKSQEVGDVSITSTSMAPMLKHYLELKRQYPEHLLLYQVGDFYELFFDDAVTASNVLSIRLTSRSKDESRAVPMAGVPIHALENYLPKLLKAGLSCLIVSQVEDSSNKKSGIAREITRIVTPGVRFEGDGLEEREYNFLAAVCVGAREHCAIAYVDVSTGELRVQEVESHDELVECVNRINPVELVLPSLVWGVRVEKTGILKELKDAAKILSAQIIYRPFVETQRSQACERVFQLVSLGNSNAEISSVTNLTDKLSLEACAAIGTVLDYVAEVSFNTKVSLSRFVVEERAKLVFIDAATRRNLELTEARIDGDRRNSLLQHIDMTRTAMGARELTQWILSPTCVLEEIISRQDAVEELLSNAEQLKLLRESFLEVRDLDRLVARISSNRASPRDFATLRDSIRNFSALKFELQKFTSEMLSNLAVQFDDLVDLFSLLEKALSSDPPQKLNEGGIFKAGFDSQLDEIIDVAVNGREWLLRLEEREKQRTGIPSLRVKYNNVFGYFIEVTKTHLDKVPSDFERRQTLVNAERFVTHELKEYEYKILSAKARQIELEKKLFVELKDKVSEFISRIYSSARVLSTLDVLASFAKLAFENNYVRPSICEESLIEITGGRHPVVEQIIGMHNFVPNDVSLNVEGRRFAVLTGPNMGGKSTYLRQIGLIQILAQAGSFVPAISAKLGIVDRIFTRIGSSDDLARGDSTFMVEMREAAVIARRATMKSLVLIDEIGRGTATADGYAIATSIAEWLRDKIRAQTVFATHFHELTGLVLAGNGMFCLSVGIVEKDGDIIFTHRIEEKAADRSYGIEVARLAGLPESLLSRASELLANDLSSQKNMQIQPCIKKIPLERKEESQILAKLRIMDLNSISPIQALNELYEIKKLAQ